MKNVIPRDEVEAGYERSLKEYDTPRGIRSGVWKRHLSVRYPRDEREELLYVL